MRPLLPFHRGELAAQLWHGERNAASRNGGIIAAEIPIRARRWLESQRMAVLATLDGNGHPWASLLLGEPGFATAPGPRELVLDLGRSSLRADDPIRDGLGPRELVGSLLIDFATGQRFRINGRVRHATRSRLAVDVEEAYPNCRRHVRRRFPIAMPVDLPEPVARGGALTLGQRQLIGSTETLFVASAHPARGADVSHRGGEPGFARALDARTLVIDDYPGNSLFNTLGNFVVYPRCGILVPDFARGRVLQLTGLAELPFDAAGQPSGEPTGRAWRVAITRWVESPLGLQAASRPPAR